MRVPCHTIIRYQLKVGSQSAVELQCAGKKAELMLFYCTPDNFFSSRCGKGGGGGGGAK